MEHPYHSDEGYAGYMMTQAAYVLYSTTKCQDPVDVGNYFIVTATAITDNDEKSEERKWQARKNLMDTYRNMRTALQQLFDIAIDPAYHSRGTTNTGMARRGFGNDEPPAILNTSIYCMEHQAYKRYISPSFASTTQFIATNR